MANRKAIKKVLEGPEEEPKKKSILSYPLGKKNEQEILKDNPKRYMRIANRTFKSIQRQKERAQKKNERAGTSETGKKFRKFTKKVAGNAKINSRNRKAKRSNRGDGGGFKCSGVVCDG